MTAAATRPLRYVDCYDGEFLEGTKEQIQAMGIGTDRAFPGEPGGPARVLRCKDPRGLMARIERDRHPLDPGPVRYWCRIEFWGDEGHPMHGELDPATGLRVRYAAGSRCFSGTAQQLLAAGLAQPHWLPGHPDCPKRTTFIQGADGTPNLHHANRERPTDREPGAVKVLRDSAAHYRLCVRLPEHEAEELREQQLEREAAWQAQQWQRPRPARLDRPRPRLSLAWSAA